MDDYFSALLAMGRRARIQRNECFLINAKHSRSALAVIDLAIGVFGAKVFAIFYLSISLKWWKMRMEIARSPSSRIFL